MDVSVSVDAKEFDLQLEGYKSAFADAEVQAGIKKLPQGLAVNMLFWADQKKPLMLVGLSWKMMVVIILLILVNDLDPEASGLEVALVNQLDVNVGNLNQLTIGCFSKNQS